MKAAKVEKVSGFGDMSGTTVEGEIIHGSVVAPNTQLIAPE